MTRPARIGLTMFALLLIVFLIAPTLILIPLSFSSGVTLQFPPPGFSLRWYEELFSSPSWTRATIISMQVAIATSILATVLGTITSFGLVRGRFPGKSLVNALVMSPLIVPIVIIAIGMFAIFSGWRLTGTVAGLVLAHTVLAMPFVVINVSASLAGMDRDLESASMSLGAGPLTTFRYVTLPSIMPGVLAGALFAFIVSWDEVVIAIFLTSPLVNTLPALLFSQVQNDLEPTIAAVATVLTLVTTSLIVIALVFRRGGTTTQ